MKDKLPAMSEAEAIDLLSQNGNLVKRPFLIGDGKALAGFKPQIWEKRFPTAMDFIHHIRWRPEIGDPTLHGLADRAAYGLAAFTAWLASRRAGRAPDSWVAAAECGC